MQTPIAIFLGLALIGLYFSPNAKAYWKDPDWNVGFYPVCDGNPEWAEEKGNKFLRFSLEDGRIGGCPSDNKERHGASHWERSLVEYDLSKDKYIITFELRFYKGFVGSRETFMQIHGYTSAYCHKPLLMFKFGKMDQMNSNTLQYLTMTRNAGEKSWINQPDVFTKIGPMDKKYNNPLDQNPSDQDLIGKWHKVKLEFNLMSNPGKISTFWNGKKEIDNVDLIIPSCSAPRIDFGIYRPGTHNKDYPNKTSIFDVDKIQIQKLND